jgi:penicillin-binding protein 2
MDRFSFVHFFRIVLGVFFAILFVALFRLQVIQGKYYKQIAESNFVRMRRLIATRGEIYDHKYRPLVVNIPSHNLYLIPGKVTDLKQLSAFLQTEFGIMPEELKEVIDKTRFRSYEDIIISENIPYENVLSLSEKLNYYPELFFRTETTRHYMLPNHFTGYVGRINETEYQLYKEEDYTINSHIGKTGLEKQYEVLLKGRDGKEIVQVDARGRSLNLFKTDSTINPINGYSLVLTIDSDIQAYVEQVFPPGMRGAIVVMDVRTGGVLAYVSKPSYDPNLFMTKVSKTDWAALNDNVAKPMLDRVIHAAYPPGSVFKPVTAGIGLEKSIINEYSLLAPCVGGMQIGNRFFRCWSRSGHGRSNVLTALKVSCDVFFYDLSLKLKLEDFKSYVQKCFLAQKTGIDLPNERNGLFPDTRWYQKSYGKGVSIVGQKVNLAIGQGEVLLTPLQICAYYSALANNGVWIQPHFLDKTVGAKTILRQQISPLKKGRLPLSVQNLKIIQQGLWGVCNLPGGTATNVKVNGATTFGKTGSAENVFGRTTHAWFSGYIVTQKPEIAVTVFLENAGHGGSAAAPLANRVMNYYMGNYQSIKAPVVIPPQFQTSDEEVIPDPGTATEAPAADVIKPQSPTGGDHD